MKVAFVNDFKLSEFIGGAMISSSLMIKKGRELGHTIIEFSSSDSEEKLKEVKNYDLLVLCNINRFKLEFIRNIVDNMKYITYNSDYAFCQFRSAQCSRCKVKCEPAQIFRDLYSNSLLNIFFSPLQLDIHKKFFGETMRDAICIPGPIEADKWSPDKDIQQDAYLYAGVLATHKGVYQILDFADSQKGEGKIFHFAGKVVNKEILDRIEKDYTYLGEIPHDKMPNLLRKYKHFVINPLMPETFGLSILEAMMSGCNIVKFSKTNPTGLESWNLSPSQLIERCSKASETFWKMIKNEK